MGFIVNKKIKTSDGRDIDSFYVRIESYCINRPTGYLFVSTRHYIDQESAKKSHGLYIGDSWDHSGAISVNISYDDVDFHDFQHGFRYNLTEYVQVPVEVNRSSWSHEPMEYIDFDDDGNEIIKNIVEWRETITTETEIQTKEKINLDIVGDDIYSYAYNRIIDSYSEIFGSDNIINETF